MKHTHRFCCATIATLLLMSSCGGNQRQSADDSSGDTANSRSPATFKKHTLTRDFISEGVAVGDVNQDGKADVMAGAYWFQAPDWKRHEIFPGKSFDGAKEYSNSFLNFSMDVNEDEWVDLIVIDFPGKLAYWYENPKNKEGHWKKHPIHESVEVGNESPAFVDVDGDGRKDLLCADSKEKQMVWLKAPRGGSTDTWKKFTISEKNAPGTERFSHGLGFGDINKDGLNDVVIKQGWWQGPKDPTQSSWKFHEANLGEDCSQMQVVDVNRDGLNDVISASAHRYGIWWHEQGRRDSDPVWTQHEISKAFSQSHSTAMADLNGDGHDDLISGKRFFAHNDTDNDPGAREPAVLCWFEYQPETEGYFTMHEIDNDSGSGLNLVVDNFIGDEKLDIAIANKKGVFVFERQ